MVELSEDYEGYVEESRPKLLVGDIVDWSEYRIDYSIPSDSFHFLQAFPSFSAYEGRLLIGDPRIFSGILPLVFQADTELHHRDTIVVGHSAFSRLFCWNRKYGPILIDLISARVECSALVHPEQRNVLSNVDFELLISVRDVDVLDEEDEDGKLLFERANKKYGPLDYGQCYGFRLALPLGGYRTLDKLEKLSAPEHFSFLAQLQPFKLIDWGTTNDFGLRVIREIG
ncbi:T6SS immunity protein Tdi1 domain-containing protein [uncultured Paracoccus sp.]|uniref:T6SS immunity protein Tdi1 domain-containing protein n=1 Tax=uncultured Paracoccus sp. TaxID=189685 RepID=UPI002632AFD1|nr:T6SS immunity protein Tdi1 domain-containing protein [uncultured Paracoccus sp.]